MLSSAALSPGLVALVAASNLHGNNQTLVPLAITQASSTSIQGVTSNATTGISSKPITGMSILQLASPSLRPTPLYSIPPAPPLHGVPAPPVSLQSNVVAPVDSPEASEESPDASMSGSEYEEEEAEHALEDEDGESVASQSCPPSPLASLAMLSADASTPTPIVPTTLSGRRSSSKFTTTMMSARRRSIGSQLHERSQSSDRASTLTLKRPKVSSTAVAPGFKKKTTAVTVMANNSEVNGPGGSSCHQCKSRRNYADLTYCSSSLNKKNKSSVCRKKYCEHCLSKFYRELPHPSAGPNSATMWSCPSCRKICCCAACRRREHKDDGGNPIEPPSADVTPMPTPLYRPMPDRESQGYNGQPVNANSIISPMHSSSPSPSVLSMQRLLLSPTNAHPMTPLPSSVHGAPSHSHKTGSSMLLSGHRLVTPSKGRSFSTSPRTHTMSNQSPPPIEGPNGVGTGAGTVPVSLQQPHSQAANASLTALSQAAMRSPSISEASNDSAHSITIALQSHTTPASTPPHFPYPLQTHPQTGSSLASSVASSPNDSGRVVSLLGGGPGTPKTSAASLYSSLLLNGGNLSSSRASAPRLPITPSSGSLQSTSHHRLRKSPSQPIFSGLNPAATLANDSSMPNGDGALDMNDDAASNDETVTPPFSVAPATPNISSLLPSFALLFSVSQLPSFQREVQAVLSIKCEPSTNRARLQAIEQIFQTFAEKVVNEEIALQLPSFVPT